MCRHSNIIYTMHMNGNRRFPASISDFDILTRAVSPLRRALTENVRILAQKRPFEEMSKTKKRDKKHA